MREESKIMLPTFVERKKGVKLTAAMQLSSLFEIEGETFAVLTDIQNNKTILSDAPSELGESVGLLMKGQEAIPGGQIDLDSNC